MADPKENRLRKVLIAAFLPVLIIFILAVVPEARALHPFWKAGVFLASVAFAVWMLRRKRRRPEEA